MRKEHVMQIHATVCKKSKQNYLMSLVG